MNPDGPFRHSAQEGLRVGPMLDLLTEMADADPRLCLLPYRCLTRETCHDCVLTADRWH